MYARQKGIKRQIVIFFTLLIALFAFPEFSCAEDDVRINGKSLSDIDDIVLEANGSRIVEKNSVLKFMKTSDGNFRFYAIKGNDDGSKLSQSSANYLEIDGGKTNTGVHPVISKKRNSDASLILMVPAAPSNSNGIKVNFFYVNVDSDANIIIQSEDIWNTTFATEKSNIYISDAVGGLFTEEDDNRELFVISYFTADGGKRPGYEQDFTPYMAIVDLKNKKVTERKLGSMKGIYPSVRIVAGDFDNDEISNEVAVIRDAKTDDYYMQVFRFYGSENISSDEFYKNSLGSRSIERIEGCDIVAGDFNKDGNQNIAVVYADKKGDEGYPTVATFEWNGSTFTKNSKTYEDNAGTLMLGSTHWSLSSWVPHYGIIAEAGDIDGNGSDEIVFLTANYGMNAGSIVVSVWGTDNNLSPSRKCFKKEGLTLSGYGGIAGTDRAESSYLERSLSLALVSIGEKTATGGVIRKIFLSKCEGDDEIKKSSDYSAGDFLYQVPVKISDGSISELEELKEVKTGDSGRAMKLLVGDFYQETVELGEPEHLIFEKERSYAAEIQTPPYHIDYVQLDFPVNGEIPTEKSVMNMTYTGSSVTYSKSQSDSEKQDVAFNTTSTLDWGVDASVSGKFKIVEGSLSGGFKDTSTKVKNSTETSEAKESLTISETTDGTDNLVLYKTDRHVWRYPVISPVANKPDIENLNGDCFMTFSLCDVPDRVQGSVGHSSQFDDYNPIHEEGNLFSYPTRIENIPYYDDRQAILTKETSITTGSKATVDLTLSSSNTDVSSLTTKSCKKINGSINASLSVGKILSVGGGATASYSKELTNTETFTKNYSQSEKFTINISDNQLIFTTENIAHLIRTQLYSDAAGIMKVAFAVDLQDSNARVWRSNGMYGSNSDPALVLPSHFSRYMSKINNVTSVVWTANNDRISALQIRGIQFWNETDDELSTSALIRGKKYKISIPVYNASFKSPEKDVEAKLQLRVINNDYENDDEIIVPLIDKKTFHIEGWTKDKESNKATVSFEWKIPEDFTAGTYNLYFVLDPENEIDELHEDWDYTNDPGGNNIGHYPIAVIEEEPEPEVSVSVKKSSSPNVSSKDFQISFKPVDDNDTREALTLEEFRDELVKQSGSFRAYASIIYNGNETLTNVFLEVIKKSKDGQEHRVAFKTIPAIFPDEERKVSFIVDPDLIKDGFFNLNLTGDGVSLFFSDENKIPDNPDNPDEPENIYRSSGGGCQTGFTPLMVIALLALFAANFDEFMDLLGEEFNPIK